MERVGSWFQMRACEPDQQPPLGGLPKRWCPGMVVGKSRAGACSGWGGGACPLTPPHGGGLPAERNATHEVDCIESFDVKKASAQPAPPRLRTRCHYPRRPARTTLHGHPEGALMAGHFRAGGGTGRKGEQQGDPNKGTQNETSK